MVENQEYLVNWVLKGTRSHTEHFLLVLFHLTFTVTLSWALLLPLVPVCNFLSVVGNCWRVCLSPPPKSVGVLFFFLRTAATDSQHVSSFCFPLSLYKNKNILNHYMEQVKEEQSKAANGFS